MAINERQVALKTGGKYNSLKDWYDRVKVYHCAPFFKDNPQGDVSLVSPVDVGTLTSPGILDPLIYAGSVTLINDGDTTLYIIDDPLDEGLGGVG